MQYKDSKQLQKRIDFYRKYAGSNIDWYDWVWDKLKIPENSMVLEVGAGHGELWKRCRNHMPNGANVVLSDNSAGMILECCHNLNGRNDFFYCLMDAQKLALKDSLFDVLIANHMLYLLNDKKSTLDEFVRLTKSDAFIYISIVGDLHLTQIHTLLEKVCSSYRPLSRNFTISEAETLLNDFFSDVILYRYKGGFKVFDLDDIFNYITSLESVKKQFSIHNYNHLKLLLRQHFEEYQCIYLIQDIGLFQCVKRAK